MLKLRVILNEQNKTSLDLFASTNILKYLFNDLFNIQP